MAVEIVNLPELPKTKLTVKLRACAGCGTAFVLPAAPVGVRVDVISVVCLCGHETEFNAYGEEDHV